MHTRRTSTWRRLALGGTLLLLAALVTAPAQAQRGSTPAHVEDLRGEATADGNLIAWDHPYPIEQRNMFPNTEDAAEFHVYRQAADGSWALIATLDARTTEELLDKDVQAGHTYRYAVLYFDGLESCGNGPGECEEDLVEVAAIPFFATPLLAGLAIAGCLGAYVWMRKSRA